MSLTLSRMCVVTRVRKHRQELVKITRVRDVWQVDHEQKLFGRSIYIDLNDKSLERFKKQQKRFKINELEFNTIIEELSTLNEQKNS